MPGLLDPLSFAGLTLRNRIVMPPMWSGQATADGRVTDAIVEYHRCRAAAGCGLVIVEHSFVHPRGRASATQIGVHEDGMLPGLTRVAAAIKAEGAVACLQISHAGPRTSRAVAGARPLGPSAVRHLHSGDGEVPEAATLEQIAEVIAAFGQATIRARKAGFDAVEIHAAHGFLLSQFLSPLSNRREDAYGGSDENRRRLHLEVLAEVRTCLGPEFAVFIRLGATDETPGGLEIEAACATADVLVRGGIDLVDVSGGLQGSRGAGQGAGYFVPYAEAIKKRVPVPVVVTGGISDPVFADRLLREDRADLVGIGRAMLDDADWARKAIATLAS
jgi:2,4-dienoyl-CoA reductase-like NADH-dependent reductase (Old Yellow Enzyme family)